MNLPNKLTVARLIVTMIFVAVLSLPVASKYSIGLALFVVAAITDYFDGEIARRNNLITNFGKLMDPLVDKILIAAAFIMLSDSGVIPAWMVVVILAREFLVTGLRLLATSQGDIVAADTLGKWKTTFQMIATIYLLLALASREAPMSFLSGLFAAPLMGAHQLGLALISLALLATVVSGWNYLWKNRTLLQWS